MLKVMQWWLSVKKLPIPIPIQNSLSSKDKMNKNNLRLSSYLATKRVRNYSELISKA